MERRMTDGLQMAALAHDLRTPMSIAAGAAQMALEAGEGDVSTQLRQILQAIRTMDAMLKTMGGKSDGRFSGDMLRAELLAMTADKAAAKGQRLSIDLSALDGLTLEGDYAALCRLLINLLGNAVKYTQEGGMITLRAQAEEGNLRRRSRRVRFIVSDNGMGMSQAFMRRMFLPYTREKGAERISGSGLGLSIAKDMARRLGGTISVRSERGKGTTFSVCVPLCLNGVVS